MSMEISLIRHGKSVLNENQKKNCKEMKEWVNYYNLSGVVEEKELPLATLNKVAHAKVIITSDLKRSIESAKILRNNVHVITDTLFREVELPIPSTKLGNIKLNPQIWSALLRCLWFCGYTNSCESYKSAKERAKQAATKLIEYTEEYHSVVVVGHGFFNLLLAKELLKRGWNGQKMKSSKHWSVSSYTYN